jgi:hypothetical protein
MAPVTITEWSPSQTLVKTPTHTTVSVTFSAQMNKTSAEEAFSLHENGEALQGRYTWEDKQLTFTPGHSLTADKIYAITVEETAEDVHGNNLEQEFVHRFKTGTDSERPTVIAVSPAANSTIDDQHAAVTVTFSEPVSRDTLYKGFSLLPHLEGAFTWKENDTAVSFHPDTGFTWQEHYTVTLAPSITDRAGNHLADEYSFCFRLGSDREAPRITFAGNQDETYTLTADDPDDHTLLINEGWECGWDPKLIFSEPVRKTDIRSQVEIHPYLEFNIPATEAEFLSTVVLSLCDRPAYDSLYSISIGSSVRDRCGNQLIEDLRFRFRTNADRSRPPEVRRVTFLHNPGGPPGIIECDQYETISLEHYAPYTPGTHYGFFDIYLGMAPAASVEMTSFIDHFSITTSNSCTEIAAVGIEMGPLTGALPTPEPASDEIIVRVHFDITDNPESGVIMLRLESGLADTLGNQMEEEWLFFLNESSS